METRQNFLIASSSNKLKFSDLVISGNNNETIDCLELSWKDILYQFKLRQSWIIRNCKSIDKAKRLANDKSYKIIEDLTKVNIKLENEINILRQTSEFLRFPQLLDTFEYQAYFANQVNKEIKISSFTEEELILEFSTFISNQKTDKAIEILKPIAANHFYRLSKMPIKA